MHARKQTTLWATMLFCLGLLPGVLQAQTADPQSVVVQPLGHDTPPSKPILRIETGMHTAAIWRADINLDNRYFVTASLDKTARVWDGKTGALLSTLRPPIGDGNEGKIYAVAISPDGQTVACGGCTGYQWDKASSIYLFNRATGTLKRRITGLPDMVSCLVYSPDGRFLAVTLTGGYGVRLYRCVDGTLVGQDKDYGDASHSASFGVVGTSLRLVTSCNDNVVRLYDIDTASGELHLRAKRKASDGRHLGRVAMASGSGKIAIGFIDLTKVSVWSGDDLSLLYDAETTELDGSDLMTVCWSIDGQWLYATGNCLMNDKSLIRMWPDGGKGPHTDMEGPYNTVSAMLPRKQGGVFFGAADPAWGYVDALGHVTLMASPITADYWKAGLRLSADGTVAAFGYNSDGKSSAVFSLTDRKLSVGGDQTGLNDPAITSEGMNVQGWNKTTHPTLNDKPLTLSTYEISHSVALAPDRSSVLLGTEWNVRLFRKDGTQVWQVTAPGAVWAVNISGDGKTAVAAFSDGTIRWFRMTDGQELCAFFPHADQKRWVLWTPSGYYDCSPGGEDLIGWHLNHGTDQAADFFPASRFRDTYYRPDVVAKVLVTHDEREALRQANEEVGHKVPVADIQKTLPPVLTILTPDNGTDVATDKVTIKYSLRTPSGEPVTNLKVLVDGRPISTPRKLVLVAAETNTPTGVLKEETVTIPHQDCSISLIAENQYAASEAATVHLTWKGAAPAAFAIKPTLYVLAIGISKYDNPEFVLNYPAKDARDIAATLLKQKGKLYEDVQVKVMTDGEATKDGITDGLEWIERQTTQHDVAMVFLSGHGANDRNGNYLFIPANFSKDHIKTTGLSFSDIKETVQNLAGKTLFFVDSCHSGNVMGTAKSRAVDITGAVNELSSAENGAIVFAASTGNQVALEDPAWNNGAFTKALVEAISGQADYNHDGTITVNMLDLYISKRVKDLTHGSQTPTTTKPQTVSDFPVAIKE